MKVDAAKRSMIIFPLINLLTALANLTSTTSTMLPLIKFAAERP